MPKTLKTTILEGIVGSYAYGLNTEDSDIDTRGVYIYPTNIILGLLPYKDTFVTTNPDTTLYELEKFLRLALQNNPNILELFYLPEYVTLGKEGTDLILIRDAFLSQCVRNTYAGYAMSQIKRLRTREAAGDASFKSKLRKRYSKHARHCFRLITQGIEILETGNLTVKVSNPEELFAIGELPPEELEIRFAKEFSKIDQVKSSLPLEPNVSLVNDLFLSIRRAHL